MKKLIFLCIAFVYIIGVFHHPIISFTHAENQWVFHNHGLAGTEHSHVAPEELEHEENHFEQDDINTSRNNEVLKKYSSSGIWIIPTLVFEYGNDYFLLENRNLVRKTSPPNYKRKTKNDRYADLVDIVISRR